MPDGKFVIDCGQGGPFLTGRKIEKVSDQQVNLLEANDSVLREIRVSEFAVEGVIGYTGRTTTDQGGDAQAVFIFDTNSARVIGAVQYPGADAVTAVWSALN